MRRVDGGLAAKLLRERSRGRTPSPRSLQVEPSLDAEILTAPPATVDAALGDGTPAVAVNEERMLGMLALTAVHDIMKGEALLPKVDAKHGPYEGFKEGVVINDHDVALGYVT